MPAICRPNGSDIGLPLSEREVSLREVNGLSSASLRASIRSLLLRSFNRAALRGSQTTSRLTWGFRRSCNQAAEVPSSKVRDRVPCSPCMNSTNPLPPLEPRPSYPLHRRRRPVVKVGTHQDDRIRRAGLRADQVRLLQVLDRLLGQIAPRHPAASNIVVVTTRHRGTVPAE